jgi:hypothetical protein
MKKIKNVDSVEHSWCGLLMQPGDEYTFQDGEGLRWGGDSTFLADLADGKAQVGADAGYLTDLAASIDLLKDYYTPNPKTEDNRDIVAINRIPPGYTVYPTGSGDAIQAVGYAAGADLKFDADNKVRRLQMLDHWYGIGGRIIWEGADLDDHIGAILKAPATTGTNTPGDFIKVATVLGFNVYVPTAPGSGDWNLNLTEKFSGTNVLKCVPVPATGNNGFFDYDSSANVISVNSQQKGGYNLYDAELPLFRFANKCWGRKQDGAETSLEIPDVIGKMLYNQWVVEFTLTTDKLAGIKVGLIMISAVKKNI